MYCRGSFLEEKVIYGGKIKKEIECSVFGEYFFFKICFLILCKVEGFIIFREYYIFRFVKLFSSIVFFFIVNVLEKMNKSRFWVDIVGRIGVLGISGF